MNVCRYSTILFDLDGTLTPSLPLWVESFRYVFSQYEQDTRGQQINDETIIKRCFYRSIQTIIDEFELSSATVPEFTEHLKIGLEKAFKRAVLYEGVVDVLKQCKKQNIKVGLVTSSPRVILDMVLQNLGIREYFGATVTADDIKEFKPHPESVHLALNKLAGSLQHAQECLIIGDSASDVLAGMPLR